jgi:glycosyltransferase involved in cell wall biosynthesis
MKVKLFDLIGIKSGMNFYSEAFYKFLDENKIETQIISNFSHNNKIALPNIFNKSKFKNIINLLSCYGKLFNYILNLNKENYIIIFVYGVVIDIPLILMARLSKRVIIDIHEVIELRNKSAFLRSIFKILYKTSPNKVISHSKKTSAILTEFSYKKEAFSVPLFHYDVDVNYDIEKVSEDVINSLQSDSKNFLFFGNIIASKGVEDLLKANSLIEGSNVKIIIAGQDISNIISNYKIENVVAPNVQLILRYINDDELKYLFTKSDFILLPYSDISQSASVEMAIAFKKPILTSNIEYFKKIIDTYPSFGKYIDTKNHTVFSDNLLQLSQKSLIQTFYSTNDIEKYYKNDEFENFIKSFKEYNFLINKKAD